MFWFYTHINHVISKNLTIDEGKVKQINEENKTM